MLHIYIISLKQDIERRQAISKSLENLGLKFIFIDAIYGRELSEDFIKITRDNADTNSFRGVNSIKFYNRIKDQNDG